MTDNDILRIGAILVGIVLCTNGFKIQKLLITIAWFCIGFLLSSLIVPNFIDSNNICLIINFVVGILLGSIGYKLEKLAILIAVAYLVYSSIGPYIKGLDPNIALLIHYGVSLLVGVLATFFIKPIMIITSSLAGSNLIKTYVPTLIAIPGNILTIIVIVIFAAGIIIQFKTSWDRLFCLFFCDKMLL